MLEFLFKPEMYGGYLWNKLIRKDIIKNIRFNENIKIEEDVEFLCRVIENVNCIVYIPKEKLYHYVKRNESAVNFNYSLKDLTKLLALEKKMKIKDEYQIKNLEKLEYEYYVIASQARYILRKYKINKHGVLHCCPFNKDLVETGLEAGLYIAFGGTCTFKNSKNASEIIELVPIEKMLVETDSPYLAPEPKRGTRNDSRNLEFIINKIAEVKNIPSKEVANKTFENAIKIFQIKE